jgi:hypothetical protein
MVTGFDVFHYEEEEPKEPEPEVEETPTIIPVNS